MPPTKATERALLRDIGQYHPALQKEWREYVEAMKALANFYPQWPQQEMEWILDRHLPSKFVAGARASSLPRRRNIGKPSAGARLFARLLEGAQKLDPALAAWMEAHQEALVPLVEEAYEEKRMRVAERELTDMADDASEWWQIERKRQRFADPAERKAPVGGVFAPPGTNLSKVAQDMITTGELIWQGSYILPGVRQPGRAVAMPDDIDKAAARQAFEGTSHFSERRGENARRDYARTFNKWAQQLRSLAEAADPAWLEAELENARQAYLGAVKSFLGSKSRTTSWMVTGPAGRNERREQKKHESADRRLQEAAAILPKAGKRIKQELETLRLEAVADKREANRQAAIKAYMDLTESATRGSGLTPHLDKRRESLRREVARLGGFGEAPQRQRLTHTQRRQRAEMLRAQAKQETAGTSTAARAAAVRAETLRAREEAAGVQEFEFSGHPWEHFGTIHELPSGTLYVDYDRDRLRLEFDERMGEAWRAVKSAGWKWSRRDQEFLRQITPNALQSARAITGLELELPEFEERMARIKAAEDAAAARVQAERKVKNAAARAGEGSFAEVLNAAMRKGSAFKVTVPSSLESPKAGKKLSPGVRKGPKQGWVLTYKTQEQARNPFGGVATVPGARYFTVVVRRSGDDVSIRLYGASGWRLEDSTLVDQSVLSGAWAQGAASVPTVIDTISQMVQAATLRKAMLSALPR